MYASLAVKGLLIPDFVCLCVIQSSVSSQVSSTQGSRASPAPSRPAAKRKSLTESSSPGKLTASDTGNSPL